MLRVETPAVNVTEYLEHLFARGVQEKDLPVVQPICQKKDLGPQAPAKGLSAWRR